MAKGGQIRYQIGFDIQKQNLEQLKTALQDLQKMSVKDVVKLNETDISSARTMLQSIRQDASKVEQALDKAFNVKLNTVNVSTFNQALRQSGTSIENVYKSFSQAGAAGEAAFRNLSTQLLSTNIQLRESHKLLDKMGQTLANTVKWNIASSAVNAISRSAQQAWGFVKALDTSLNDIRIVTGKSADEMANFAIKANDAAQSLGKSTTDYTNAALIYAQQGLSDKEVEERAKITLKAANVTGQSTSDVSEQLTAVWNGYKVTAQQAELYVDRLAAVAATTASDLEELSTGMSKVASAAAAMGVSEEQLAAQLSTIISATRQAPESVGTALRTVYARISDIKAGIDEDGVTLGNYSGKMKALGFSVLDVNGNLRDMGEVIEEIGGRWQNLTREQQVNLAQTMAGQRQYNNLLALFDNFEKYNESLNVAQNAAGTLQKQQDTYMESTASHLEALNSAIERIYNSLADTDSINKIIDVLKDAANFAGTFVDSIGGGAGVLRALGSIGITVFSKQIGSSIQTTINNLEKAKTQAQLFEDAIAQAKELQNKGLGNDYTQFLNRESSSLLQMGGKLSTDDFNAIQKNLQQLSQNSGQIEIVEEKIELLNKGFNSLGLSLDATSAKWGTLDDMLSSADGVEEVKKALEKLKQQFDPIVTKQEKVSQAFTAMYLDIQRQSPNAVNSFNTFKKQLDGLIYTLQNTTIKQTGEKLFSTLPESSRKSVEQAQLELQKLNFNDPNAVNQITQLFRNINSVITKEIENIQSLIESADKGELEALQAKLEKLQATQRKVEAEYDHLKEKAQKSITTQDITKTIGSITQIGSAIKQVQNLGSIWKNADLTDGQKVLQIVTNLGASLPMLITGFKNLKEAMSLSALQTGVIAGFSAIIAVIGMVVSAYQEAKQAAIEANNAIIDSENKKQEEIQTNKQLITSLQELDKKYQEHEISRSDLKTAVEDLIDQYHLEEAAANSLRNSYTSLNDEIERMSRATAKEGRESAQRELLAAESNITEKATEGAGHRGYIDSQQYVLSLSKGIHSYYEEPQELINLLENVGFNKQGLGEDGLFNNLTTSIDFSTKSILDLYDRLDQTFITAGTTIDNKILQNSNIYKELNDWLTKMQPEITKYRNALQDLQKYSTALVGIDNFDSNINNINQYIAARQKLIDEIIASKDIQVEDEAAAASLADAYIRENYRTLYTEFNDYSTIVDKFKDKFGEIGEKDQEVINDIVKQMSELDPDHMGKLMDFVQLHPQVINSWDQLRQIIEKITGLDLSNVTINSPQQDAAVQYNKYQSVEDTVRSGKTISSETYGQLDPILQNFFKRTIDGTYKMEGAAKEFYATVDNLKLQKYRDRMQAINQEIEHMSELQTKNLSRFNSDELIDSAWRANEVAPNTQQYSFEDQLPSIDSQRVENQIEYVEAIAASGSELELLTEGWRRTIKEQGYSKELCDQIAATVQKVKEQTDNAGTTTADLTEQYKELAHIIYEGMFPTDEDIDTEALQTLSETIQDIADESNELSDDLIKNANDAEDVAESILRFDDAIVDVVDNYDNWMAALKSDAVQDQVAVFNELKDAYSDLLDLDGASLSDEFLSSTKNLDLMKAAIDGDVEAYDELMQLAQQDIAAQVHLDTTQFQNDFDQLMKLYYFGQDLGDMEIGASLNNSDFLAGLSQMVNAANMTAQQATDYLSSMGVDAEVIEQKNTGTEESTQTGWSTELTPVTRRALIPMLNENGELERQSADYLLYSASYIPQTTTTVDTKENSAFSLKVTSAHKSSGGAFKFKQASNGGGAKGVARRTATPKSSGKSGGGSSKSPSPDTSKKDTKNPAKDTRDIYHDINIELKQIEREIDRVQEKQDRLYGKELLDNLNKQQELLEKHKNTLAEKQKLQEWDLQNQRKTLENLDVTFDAYGNISNYMDILGQKQAAVNAKTKEYNDLVSQYNAETDKDAKKQIADQMDAVNKQLKAAEDDYKNLQDKIKSYDGLREDMEDLVDQVEEETQKQIEIEIEKFRMELEIRLDMGEAERDWNKFRREVLEHTDLLKDSDFDKIYNDAQLSSRDLTSYFNVGDGVGSIETLMNQLMNTRNELEAINETGTSAIYGDNKAQAMEDLQNDLDKLMNQMEDIEGLIDDIDKAYFDTIDDVDKNFDKQIEDYEFVGDLIEHDIDLLTLLYGEQNYNAMEKYYNTLQENNLKQLDSLKQQRDFWKQQWDEAVARGDSQAAEEFEKNYKETFKKLNSAIEESAKNLQTAYENAINGIFDALDKQISGGMGTDYANMEWELMQKNANEYLDTINSAFAIQDTQRKYQQAIDNTQNVKDQQKLKELMDEQVGALRDKERISEYDVQRAEKLLQIEQARIALEDARAAKTTMRLKRDSQGNYTYEYKADDDAIGDAAGQLATAQQDLYNFDKEAYQANLKDMLAAWQDFQNQYKKILLDTSLSEEDRIAQLALLREQYGEYINNKTEENYVIRMNYTDSFYDSLMQMYAANADNYAWMTDQERDTLIGNLEQSKEAYKDSLAIQLEDFIAYREQYDAIINSDLTEQEKDQAIKNLQIENHQLELQNFEDYRKSYDAILNNDTTEEQKLTLINDLQKGYTEEQLTRAQDYRKKYDEIMNNRQLTAKQKEEAIAKLRSQYSKEELNTFDDYKKKYEAITKEEKLTAEQKEILIAGLKSKYTNAQVDTLEKYRIKYNKIANDETIDAKKKEEAIAKLQSDYAGKREGFLKSAFGVAAGLYTDNEKQYKTMLNNESNLLTKQFLPTWNGSIQKMSNTFSGKGGFLPTAQKAFTDIAKETANYTNSLDKMAKAAGTDFGKIKSGANDAAKELSNLITKNKTLIDSMGTELDSIQKLDTAARNLKDAYNGVYEQAKNAAKAIQDVIKAEQLDAAQKAAEQAKKDAQAASTSATKPMTTPSNTNNTSTGANTTKPTIPTLSVGSAVKLKDNAVLAMDSLSTPSIAPGNWAKNKTLYVQQVFTDGRKAPYHIGTTASGINDRSTWVGWVDKKQLQGFKSGGYTGKWNDDMEGKLALLHQKELVLNQEDTKNLLNTVTILRTITSSLGGVAFSRLNNIKSNFINDLINKNNLQQDIHIEANFPNVNSKREIEEAFDNLINEAAQRSNNRDR